MKKFLLVFAACVVFVACGGEKKEPTIEEKTVAMATAAMEAYVAYIAEDEQDYYDKFATLRDEMNNYIQSLPEEQIEIAIEIRNNISIEYQDNIEEFVRKYRENR